MDPRFELINKAKDYINAKTGGLSPKIGIVLGSGLGKLAESIENRITVPYRDIPGFPVSTAVGHKGNFIIGKLGGKDVIAMQGRFHYYEGYPMEMVTLGVRVMKTLGIDLLFVSNAAGACNPSYSTGELIIIKDHISFFPNPLIGKNFDEFGERFPDMTCPYDAKLRKTAHRIGEEIGLDLKEGVYFGSTGPTYETPAEVRFYRSIGADLLGMSTIPEVIVARHCGLRVFGMSVVTNISNTENVERNLNDSDDVVKQADLAADRMTLLFSRMIEEL